MNKIATCLWFDNQAEEAVRFYIDTFDGGTLGAVLRYPEVGQETTGGKPGSVMTIDFEIQGARFTALNGGPLFKLNPSISFIVNYDPSAMGDAEQRLREAWTRLAENGKVRMPLQEYPFSKLYGWVEDKYGVSWQLMLTNPQGEPRPFIIPSLMLVGDNCGKAEEAGNFYLSIFKNSKRGTIARYPAGMEPDKKDTVMFSDFMLENQWFAAMDSAHEHDFNFNEAVSFVVNCADQAEVDYYWQKLSAVPESERCGWLKDKYGVSWQIVPVDFLGLLTKVGTDTARYNRVMDAFLKMKKIDMAKLRAVAE